MRWYVAVTTAPRKEPTLDNCIISLRDCGWEHPIVFAEPDSPQTDALTIHHPTRLGVWRNWVYSVREALRSDAEVIMTVQDDSEFHPDSKDFVESIMWPAKDTGFVSLYTPKHYTVHDLSSLRKLRRINRNTPEIRNPGVNRIYTRSLWGACALVWPRKVLEHIITCPTIDNWLGAIPRSRDPKVYQMRRENPHIIANSDTAIGKIMNQYNYSMWFVDPSPVSHIARYSAIGHGGNDGRRNAYRIADRTIPLTTQVPTPTELFSI